MILNLFSLIILLTLLFFFITALLLLGGVPGKIAEKRNHAQAEAVKVCGWIGILTGGPLWLAAIIWAYAKTSRGGDSNLESRLRKVEDQLEIRSNKKTI